MRSTLLSEENYARISRASPALPRVVMIDKESQLLHRDGIKQRSFIYLMESYAQEMSLAPFWDASPAIGCKKPFIFDIFRRASTPRKSRAPQIKKWPQSQHHWHKAQLGYTPSCILLVVAVVKWLTLLFRATGPTWETRYHPPLARRFSKRVDVNEKWSEITTTARGVC